MLYFNTNVGATLYRTIRGGASATVEKARRVERMNAADRAERAVGQQAGGAAGARDRRGRGAAEGDL